VILMMNLNPVAEHLKSAATSAPFKLEKENYLMAVQEIERLHDVIQQLHAHVNSDQELFVIFQRVKRTLESAS
jgi:hypothetical protein